MVITLGRSSYHRRIWTFKVSMVLDGGIFFQDILKAKVVFYIICTLPIYNIITFWLFLNLKMDLNWLIVLVCPSSVSTKSRPVSAVKGYILGCSHLVLWTSVTDWLSTEESRSNDLTELIVAQRRSSLLTHLVCGFIVTIIVQKRANILHADTTNSSDKAIVSHIDIFVLNEHRYIFLYLHYKKTVYQE